MFLSSSKFTVTPSFYGRVLSGSGNYPLPSLIWWGEPYRGAICHSRYRLRASTVRNCHKPHCWLQGWTSDSVSWKPVYISDGQLWAKLREVSSDSWLFRIGWYGRGRHRLYVQEFSGTSGDTVELVQPDEESRVVCWVRIRILTRIYQNITWILFFRQKNRRTREKYVLLFFCLKLTPNLYDSAVSYDTFVIYSASIRFRPYRP